MYIRIVCLMLFVTNLLGCLSHARIDLKEEKLALINHYTIDKGHILFEITGHGCTFYSNFKIDKENRSNNELKVVQLVEDQCKMAPRKVVLNFSIRHLDLEVDKEISLANRVNNSLSEVKLVK